MAKAETKQKEIMTVSSNDLGVRIEEPKKGSAVAFSQWIRSLMQNWRQGTVAAKGRSDVTRSGKKPFKQKGTGRARAGDAKSPLWRGGGVIFGPQKRSRTLKISKGIKKTALNALLHDYLTRGKIIMLDWKANEEKPDTSSAYSLLKRAGFAEKKVVMFVPMEDIITYASFRNLPRVQLMFFDQADAYNLAKNDYWLFLKKDLDQFKEMVSRWT